MRVTDSYDAIHVYLTAEKIRNVGNVGGTPNETQVGGAIDTLPGDNGLGTAVTWLSTGIGADWRTGALAGYSCANSDISGRAGLRLSADYAGQLGDGLQDHGFKVNLNWAF